MSLQATIENVSCRTKYKEHCRPEFLPGADEQDQLWRTCSRQRESSEKARSRLAEQIDYLTNIARR